MKWKNITGQGDGSWIGYRACIGFIELTVTRASNANRRKWDATVSIKKGYDYIDLFWLKNISSRKAAQKKAVKVCKNFCYKLIKAFKKKEKLK